jgi:hypothetical protein
LKINREDWKGTLGFLLHLFHNRSLVPQLSKNLSTTFLISILIHLKLALFYVFLNLIHEWYSHTWSKVWCCSVLCNQLQHIMYEIYSRYFSSRVLAIGLRMHIAQAKQLLPALYNNI